ncbi:MAG: ROK family protein [Burkholderiaceae bacterium]|nr:ROK family protein [Burkholderiaceae bacterium]
MVTSTGMERARFGIDLGGTKIALAALDRTGKVLLRRRVSTPRGDYAATIETIAGLVEVAESELGMTASVGVGTPGAPSRVDGLMKNCNSVVLNGRPLAADLEARLARPIRIANDADCFALSEAADGAARGAGVVFGVILGTGVGGGIVVDGRLLRGPNAIAGEWGHDALPWPQPDELPGPACYCGRRGCLETWLSGPALAREAAARKPGLPDADDVAAVVRRAQGGDADAAAALDAWFDRLARGLAMVINILDPDAIVLGGGLSAIDATYVEVPRRWGRHVFSDRVDTALLRPVHGDDSGVLGAARLWSS